MRTIEWEKLKPQRCLRDRETYATEALPRVSDHYEHGQVLRKLSVLSSALSINTMSLSSYIII